ncbi:MAG: phytanoyl-CoA dioxygenase family protein [Candidatus Latescibacterota bacterium]
MVEQHQADEEFLLPARSGKVPSAAEEAVLAGHVEEYKTRGFTVLRDVLSADEVEILRAHLDKRMERKMASQLNELDGEPATGADWARAGHTVSIGGPEDSALIGYPGLLAAAPEVAEPLIKPFLLSPRLLDLAERVMGPYVQGDGFYVVGTPPTEFTGREPGTVPHARLVDETAGWHRDGYNHHNMWRKNPGYMDDLADGEQSFTPPLAAHMLCYLQDMNGPGGPLLAVPGSHLSAMGDKPVGAEKEAVIQVDAKAGDVVFFHCDMLHSGTANRAEAAWRYMITSFVVRAGLPHRDDFTECPLVRTLIAEAGARGDRRVLRFFAADTDEGGPLSREEAQWVAAVEAERELLRTVS